MPPDSASPLLDARAVAGYFDTYDGPVAALHDFHLRLDRGEVRGLVGETGSGKSTAVSLIVGLAAPNFTVTQGEIWFDGLDILQLHERALRRLRGKRISIALQDPRLALNPVITVGEQMARVARQHHGTSWPESRRLAVDLLRKVQIGQPERRVQQYPHELSGGMAQRVTIALALLPEPELLILDEPTAGLDVTVQADILDLLQSIVRDSGLTALVISHDLGVVAQVCDAVTVMQAGRVVEDGPARRVLETPAHPYTRELADAAWAAAGTR